MVWYIHTIPPELIKDSCLHFDNSVIQEFEFLIGHGLPSHSLCQTQLGTKFGGLGLRSSKAHASAAYLPIFWLNSSLEKRFKPLTCFRVYPVLTR